MERPIEAKFRERGSARQYTIALHKYIDHLESQLKEREERESLILARVRTLEQDREIQLMAFAKWFFDSEYYTPRHGKLFGAKRAVDEFLTSKQTK